MPVRASINLKEGIRKQAVPGNRGGLLLLTDFENLEIVVRFSGCHGSQVVIVVVVVIVVGSL